MIYNDITLRYFDSAPSAGTLSGSDVRRGAAGDREQGTHVQFEVRAGSGLVQAARFLAFGCPHTIAVCAYLASLAEGGADRLDLPEGVEALMQRFAIPVEKRGRLLIVEDAWRAAMGRVDLRHARP